MMVQGETGRRGAPPCTELGNSLWEKGPSADPDAAELDLGSHVERASEELAEAGGLWGHSRTLDSEVRAAGRVELVT